MLEKIRRWYRILPDKKRYLEFITAFLTIPVLLTVIYTNVVRIQDEKKTDRITPAPTAEKIIIINQKEPGEKPVSPSVTPKISTSPSETSAVCKKEVGPVKISSPSEEEIVQDDLICVKIDYTVGEYCSVAWSYKLDDNKWSDYTSSPFCFSKLNQGKHELDLRVQSVASGDELTLTRTFFYKSKEAPPTPTPTSLP